VRQQLLQPPHVQQLAAGAGDEVVSLSAFANGANHTATDDLAHGTANSFRR
jgi:hypothetical protein